MPDPDIACIVLEVGSAGARAKITPFADDGVAEIPIMALVGEAKEYDVLDLATGDAVRTQRRGSIDLRAHLDNGPFARGKGSPDKGPLHDLRLPVDIDRTGGRIEHTMLKPCAFLDKDGIRVDRLDAGWYRR